MLLGTFFCGNFIVPDLFVVDGIVFRKHSPFGVRISWNVFLFEFVMRRIVYPMGV